MKYFEPEIDGVPTGPKTSENRISSGFVPLTDWEHDLRSGILEIFPMWHDAELLLCSVETSLSPTSTGALLAITFRQAGLNVCAIADLVAYQT